MAGPGSTSARRLGLALAWLAVLLLAGWWIAPRIELSGDLRKFMPSAQTPAQKLLIDELGEGPGSRLLLLALSGADADVLAAQSDALRARLADVVSAAEKKEGSNPTQGQVDPKQKEQHRDFQMKGDGAGPKPGG